MVCALHLFNFAAIQPTFLCWQQYHKTAKKFQKVGSFCAHETILISMDFSYALGTKNLTLVPGTAVSREGKQLKPSEVVYRANNIWTKLMRKKHAKLGRLYFCYTLNSMFLHECKTASYAA